MSRLAPGYAVYDFTPGQRMLTQLRVVFLYLGLLVYPAPWRLNLEYDFPLSNSLLEPLSTLLALLGILGLIAVSIVSVRRHRLISFAILWYLRKRISLRGGMLPLYLAGYGGIRFGLEFFRQPDAHLGAVFLGFSMGQVLCFAMLLAGLAVWCVLRQRASAKPLRR